MELFIFRHAEAVERGTPGYENDFDRPLTPKGEKRTQRVARGMKRLELTFDKVLTSPFVRARQTAQLAAQGLGCEGRVEEAAELGADRNCGEMLEALRRRYGSCDRVLLVGHEPYLSELVSRLVVEKGLASLDFKKAGLAKVTVEWQASGPAGELNWLLTPRQLELLGGKDKTP